MTTLTACPAGTAPLGAELLNRLGESRSPAVDQTLRSGRRSVGEGPAVLGGEGGQRGPDRGDPVRGVGPADPDRDRGVGGVAGGGAAFGGGAGRGVDPAA